MGCGCQQRKEIMFDAGDMGRTELIIMAIAGLALAYAIYRKVT